MPETRFPVSVNSFSEQCAYIALEQMSKGLVKKYRGGGGGPEQRGGGS